MIQSYIDRVGSGSGSTPTSNTEVDILPPGVLPTVEKPKPKMNLLLPIGVGTLGYVATKDWKWAGALALTALILGGFRR